MEHSECTWKVRFCHKLFGANMTFALQITKKFTLALLKHKGKQRSYKITSWLLCIYVSNFPLYNYSMHGVSLLLTFDMHMLGLVINYFLLSNKHFFSRNTCITYYIQNYLSTWNTYVNQYLFIYSKITHQKVSPNSENFYFCTKTTPW